MTGSGKTMSKNMSNNAAERHSGVQLKMPGRRAGCSELLRSDTFCVCFYGTRSALKSAVFLKICRLRFQRYSGSFSSPHWGLSGLSARAPLRTQFIPY